jgi:hypothetical protein
MPLDVMPQVRGGAGGGGQGSSTTALSCVVWKWDGSFISLGTALQPQPPEERDRKGGGGHTHDDIAEMAVCIEGDTLGIELDLDEGWVEFGKGDPPLILRRIHLSKIPVSQGDTGAGGGAEARAAPYGVWFPMASSGGACTLVLQPKPRLTN